MNLPFYSAGGGLIVDAKGYPVCNITSSNKECIDLILSACNNIINLETRNKELESLVHDLLAERDRLEIRMAGMVIENSSLLDHLKKTAEIIGASQSAPTYMVDLEKIIESHEQFSPPPKQEVSQS